MNNYAICADLLKLKGAFTANIKGKEKTKKCLCIPLDEGQLYLGEKGCYLNLTAFEMHTPKFDDTHCVKVHMSKKERDKLSEDERKAIPIVGGMKPLESSPQLPQVTAHISTETDGDLPF